MIQLAATVTAFSDDAFPGWVDVQFHDSHGISHTISEKAPVIGEGLDPRGPFPQPVALTCEVLHQDFQVRSDAPHHIVSLAPRGLGEAGETYSVARQQLSHVRPTVYSDLSVSARQAVALIAFQRWLRGAGVNSPILDDLTHHLWEFSLVTPDGFRGGYEAHPWTKADLIGRPPKALLEVADAHALGVEPFTGAVHSLIFLTYGGLFGGIESAWSLEELGRLLAFTRGNGIEDPDPEPMADSLWVDDEWGRHTSEQVDRWRRLAAEGQ